MFLFETKLTDMYIKTWSYKQNNTNTLQSLWHGLQVLGNLSISVDKDSFTSDSIALNVRTEKQEFHYQTEMQCKSKCNNHIHAFYDVKNSNKFLSLDISCGKSNEYFMLVLGETYASKIYYEARNLQYASNEISCKVIFH